MDYNDGRAEAKLVRFATEKWTGEKADVPAFENKPVWDVNGNVVHMTDDHFDDYKAGLSSGMFVMFYAPW